MSPDATLREIKAVDSGIYYFPSYLELLILLRESPSYFPPFLRLQKIRKIYC